MIKVGLSPSNFFIIICLNDNPLIIMKNAFYFILKALFVLKQTNQISFKEMDPFDS